MKTCISTYSYSKAIKSGKMTQYDCIDYNKKLGVDGLEIVILDGDVPEDHTFASYVKLLCDHAREVGLEVPILTMASDLYLRPEADFEMLKGYIDVAAENNIPLMRHDITFRFRGDEDVKSPYVITEKNSSYCKGACRVRRIQGC